MTDAKARLLAGVGADLRAALECWPEHFFATAAAVSESAGHDDVLAKLVELFAASTAAARRRADAAEAQLAAVRRSHLALAPEPVPVRKRSVPA